LPELDALLLEIRTEPNYRHGDHGCESACCAAPEPIQTVVDVPATVVVTPGAVMTVEAPGHNWWGHRLI